MRWCTYRPADSAHERAGLVENGKVLGLNPPRPLLDVIRTPKLMARAAESARQSPLEVHELVDVEPLAPIPVPPSIRDFMAFEEHVVTSSEALGLTVPADWYQIPVFYFTNPAAVRGPNQDVRISPGSKSFYFELEVAAVIGEPGSDIQAADADKHIAGYTVFCDWSARDLQEREMRLNLGPAKGKDTATSIGPVLVTPDELEHYRAGKAYDLEMTASVNGRLYSRGNFSSIYWSFPKMIERASRGTELRTGDVIGSGTVGTGCILELSRVHGADAYPWLSAGDVVELNVARIGSLHATIKPAQHPAGE